MPDTMKAVRFHGKEDLRFEDIPNPSLPPTHIRLTPAYNGICGTDLHEYSGGPNLCPTTPHPITRETVPLTFGHEFSGIVTEVGPAVPSDANIKPGDRVCVQPIIYDGTCGACKEGYINCCYSNGFVGLSGWGGGLAESCFVPASCVVKLPDNVSLRAGALIEPLAVGWHAVNMSEFEKLDVKNVGVLVTGGGPIGLAVIQALKARGAGKVIVSEISGKRKEFAKDFGADYVLDPTKDDVVARCKELCEGQGVHVAFDCAGVKPGLDAAILATRARGLIVNIAVWEKPVLINVNDLVFKERKYMGIATYQAGDFQAVLSAISEGRMKPEGMITKEISLDKVLKEGFESLLQDKGNLVKVMVQVRPPKDES
ncbi:GroES-like protein [Aulographum hederae CBS 113979]|uniref:GroES-like protein n=1 Tax=Aulographum hederae CBS 113979 TaxID=1176131 RepID=A0A6G1H6Y8_9PEZI|nr:GroES-like protein [Aulographum hederae CBS 113979]